MFLCLVIMYHSSYPNKHEQTIVIKIEERTLHELDSEIVVQFSVNLPFITYISVCATG